MKLSVAVATGVELSPVCRRCPYHEGGRCDVGEEVHRDAAANEHSRRQPGEPSAAASAGGVSTSVVANHHPAFLQVPETLLQIATETLSARKTQRHLGNRDQDQ